LKYVEIIVETSFMVTGVFRPVAISCWCDPPILPRVSWKPRNGRLECGNPHENTPQQKWKFGLEDDFPSSFRGVFF